MHRARAAVYDIAFFIALLSTGLALGGALAHLFELPNKIDLPLEEYFVVQKAYRGWWQLAYLLAFQLVSMLAVIVMSRRQPRRCPRGSAPGPGRQRSARTWRGSGTPPLPRASTPSANGAPPSLPGPQ